MSHFDFENLNAYNLAMEFTLFVRTLKIPAIDRKVFNHYEIALGSAGEAAAALDIIRRGKRDAHSAKIRQVGRLLAGLAR